MALRARCRGRGPRRAPAEGNPNARRGGGERTDRDRGDHSGTDRRRPCGGGRRRRGRPEPPRRGGDEDAERAADLPRRDGRAGGGGGGRDDRQRRPSRGSSMTPDRPEDPQVARWRSTTRARALGSAGERRDRFATSSDIEIADLYSAADLDALGFDPERDLGLPGEPPFTRGVQATMYRSRFWTMRQYAGFATAEETNQRFRYLLEHGQTGLSVAFDLPTQMGYDSDAPEADGEVGWVGVPISSLADMEILLDGLP